MDVTGTFSLPWITLAKSERSKAALTVSESSLQARSPLLPKISRVIRELVGCHLMDNGAESNSNLPCCDETKFLDNVTNFATQQESDSVSSPEATQKHPHFPKAETIALFGLGSDLGQRIFDLAIRKGYRLRVLVDNETISNMDGDVHVIHGDLEESECINETIQSCDRVILVAGDQNLWQAVRGKYRPFSEFTRRLIDGMISMNMQHLIVVTSWGADPKEAEWPWYFRRLIRPLALNMFLDQAQVEQQVQNTCPNSIKWTIVRPTMLSNNVTKQAVAVSDSKLLPNSQSAIHRADVARFIVRLLTTAEWINKKPVLFYQ
jgi:putative NADH-flavin reductase